MCTISLVRAATYRILCLVTFLVGANTLATAQYGYGPQPFTLNFGAGVTPLVGQISNKLDNGWHITFGGGFRVTRRFSLGGQFMYSGLGVSQNVLNEANVPNGDAHIWSLTLEPRVTFLTPRHKVNPYFVGGVGYYRRVVDFTTPVIAPVTIFDPFFGFGTAFIPANRVIGRISRDGIGGSAGLGFAFKLGDSGVKLFTEARYHYADTGRVPTRMVPVTFGIRW